MSRFHSFHGSRFHAFEESRLHQRNADFNANCVRWITGVKSFGGTLPFDYVAGNEVVKVYLVRTDTYSWNNLPPCNEAPGTPNSAVVVTEISRKYGDLKFSSLTTGLHGLVHSEERTDEEVIGTVFDQWPSGVAPGSVPDPTDLFWDIGPGGNYFHGDITFNAPGGRCGDAGGSDIVVVDETTQIQTWRDGGGNVSSTKTSVLSSPYTKAEWFGDAEELMDLVDLDEDFLVTFDDVGQPPFTRFGCAELGDGIPTTNELQMAFVRAFAGRVFRGVHGIQFLETGASFDAPAQKIAGSDGVTCKKAFFPNVDPYTVLCVTKRLQTWSGGAYVFGDYLCVDSCPPSSVIFRCSAQGELYRNHLADDDPDCCDCS